MTGTVWNEFETGVYPPQVSQWVDSLPENMRAQASSKLSEWANELGSKPSDASCSYRAVAVAAVGVAGVLALALAL